MPVTVVAALHTLVITTTMQEQFYLSHSSDEKTKILKAKLAAQGLGF